MQGAFLMFWSFTFKLTWAAIRQTETCHPTQMRKHQGQQVKLLNVSSRYTGDWTFTNYSFKITYFDRITCYKDTVFLFNIIRYLIFFFFYCSHYHFCFWSQREVCLVARILTFCCRCAESSLFPQNWCHFFHSNQKKRAQNTFWVYFFLKHYLRICRTFCVCSVHWWVSDLDVSLSTLSPQSLQEQPGSSLVRRCWAAPLLTPLCSSLVKAILAELPDVWIGEPMKQWL